MVFDQAVHVGVAGDGDAGCLEDADAFGWLEHGVGEPPVQRRVGQVQDLAAEPVLVVVEGVLDEPEAGDQVQVIRDHLNAGVAEGEPCGDAVFAPGEGQQHRLAFGGELLPELAARDSSLDGDRLHAG